MPLTTIENLSDRAKTWVFGISPALASDQQATLLAAVDAFLDRWAAHGQPIRAARTLLHGSFLVVAADETAETSGCSIDAMFGTLKKLEQTLNVEILDGNRIFFRDGERVRAVARNEFKSVASLDSVVFDVTAERLDQLRTGAWERPASESWHRQLLG
jgi:hypothetical protein